MKEKTGVARSTWHVARTKEEIKMPTNFLSENLKKRDHTET
jgi:hypothetical protein